MTAFKRPSSPNGLFTENEMDTALVRLFTARMKLGEFDDPNLVPWVAQARARVPSWVNSNSNLAITETPERLAMARESGAKSIVLLKNNDTTKKDGTTGKLLPMQVPASGPFSVYVIGYFSNPNSMYLGGYSSSQQRNGVVKMVNGYNGLRNAILAINRYPGAEQEWRHVVLQQLEWNQDGRADTRRRQFGCALNTCYKLTEEEWVSHSSSERE
jgi:beta-glucosidase